MDKFKDVFEGKIKKEDLTPEELVGYVKFVGDLAKEEEGKISGIRSARQAEEAKRDTAKAEAERITKEREAGNGGTPSENPQMKQFRDEQVLKAKNKLWSTLQVSDAEKAIIEEKFARLDSGKVDADLIYVDLLSSVAASNPQKFIELTQDRARMEREAVEETARQAGGAGGSGGGGNDEKKFSDEVLKLAKDAGITPEAAQKQVSQGNRRTY